jgi:hypothetical protein
MGKRNNYFGIQLQPQRNNKQTREKRNNQMMNLIVPDQEQPMKEERPRKEESHFSARTRAAIAGWVLSNRHENNKKKASQKQWKAQSRATKA